MKSIASILGLVVMLAACSGSSAAEIVSSQATTETAPARTDQPGEISIDDIQPIDAGREEFCNLAAEQANTGVVQLSQYGTNDFDDWCFGMWAVFDLYHADTRAGRAELCAEFYANSDAVLLRSLQDSGLTRDVVVGMIDSLYINCP